MNIFIMITSVILVTSLLWFFVLINYSFWDGIFHQTTRNHSNTRLWYGPLTKENDYIICKCKWMWKPF